MGGPPPPHNENRPVRGGLVADMVMAIRFYSRLPIPGGNHEAPDLSRIGMAVPFAGLVIGAGPALLLLAGGLAGLPSLFVALAALVAWVMVTGAMSEDALADAADGLFGGSTPERRLEILKDSRHGTYGVLALVLAVGLKAAALAHMATVSPLAAALAWLAASTIARAASLYLALALRPARAQGAAATAGRISRNAFLVGIVFACAIGFLLVAPFVGVLGVVLSYGLAALVVVWWTRLCDRLVAGMTGDLIGALQGLVEIVLLASLMGLVTP
ncbi:adenosylcobinamide-GDP ribazoletransferase [Pelagibacterium montanilacus]|uniref:adenosylcobinamide-GDP ribazoletransferase n=1 Tax=Pelagibacterium montanilacus TaxID=2185280 RepID=UPI0013E045B0|nr:adenosylcobinamide-GDP ribazoletransferase [Pelagibacterium montanilacus]